MLKTLCVPELRLVHSNVMSFRGFKKVKSWRPTDMDRGRARACRSPPRCSADRCGKPGRTSWGRGTPPSTRPTPPRLQPPPENRSGVPSSCRTSDSGQGGAGTSPRHWTHTGGWAAHLLNSYQGLHSYAKRPRNIITAKSRAKVGWWGQTITKATGRPYPQLNKLKCCFTSTETVGLLGTGAQDVHSTFTQPLSSELSR